MKILFLVHVEDTFRRFFPDPDYPLRLAEACRSGEYDVVWVMVSNIDDDEPIYEVREHVGHHQWIDWAWGYEPSMFEGKERKYVIDALGHEFTWIPPEIRDMEQDLKKAKVYVGGGYDSECLQDFCDILDHLGIDYEKMYDCIYG